MNITFLIGNGFDLNLGLKTSYKDFYRYYNAQPSKSELIEKLKKNIGVNHINWSDLEVALGKYTEHLNYQEFDEIYDDIHTCLADYITQAEKDFIIDNYDISNLYVDLFSPERYFNPANQTNFKDYRNIWGTNTVWNTNIITFNYSTSLEKLLNYKNNNIRLGGNGRSDAFLHKIKHVHGLIGSQMCLGVNDISQIGNESFRENTDITDMLVKPSTNKMYGHMIDDECVSFISNSNLICLFGLSIGETDKMWWELIGKQLKGSQCRIIFFIKEELRITGVHKTRRIDKEVRDEFLSKLGLTDQEKEKIKNNVFVGYNTKIFNFK